MPNSRSHDGHEYSPIVTAGGQCIGCDARGKPRACAALCGAGPNGDDPPPANVIWRKAGRYDKIFGG